MWTSEKERKGLDENWSGLNTYFCVPSPVLAFDINDFRETTLGVPFNHYLHWGLKKSKSRKILGDLCYGAHADRTGNWSKIWASPNQNFSVCLPSDTLLQHLPSYLGSLTLGVGYLFMAAPAKRSHCYLSWTRGISSSPPFLRPRSHSSLDVGS